MSLHAYKFNNIKPIYTATYLTYAVVTMNSKKKYICVYTCIFFYFYLTFN